MRPNSGKGWLGRLISSRCWRSINEMVIVGKTSFRVREPCPSFYLFGCLYYTIRTSRFTRGGGDFEKAPATKATKAQNFPNSLSIYYFKISFYKNTVLSLQLADKWCNQAICCCTGAAQTCTNCTELPLAPHHTPSPIPRIAPKVASKRATQTPAPRINSTKSFLRKTKEKNKTDSPTTSKWQIGLFLWQKAARREPERSAASAKRAVTPHRGSRGAAPARLW